MVVLFGDAAICLVVILGVSVTNLSGETNVAILTSAFTAVATMTTAYFGIRSIANTAQSSVAAASSAQPPAAIQKATDQAVSAQAAAQAAADQAIAAQQTAAGHATVAQEAAAQTSAAIAEPLDDQLEHGVATDDDVTHQDEDPEAEQLAGEEVAYDLGDDDKGGG